MATTADKTPPSVGGESSTTAPPVEMSDLQSKATAANPATSPEASQQEPQTTSSPPQHTTSDDTPQPPAASAPTTSTDMTATHDASTEPAAAASPTDETNSKSPAPTPLNKIESEAIGPSSENATVKADPSAGPAVVMTLLLASGARHPYKIDEKYLKKRNVSVEEMDPFNVSVYTLKELILRDWREEWEPKPNAPSSIRLIYMGRMLDDRDRLRECRFNEAAPNVVHMTIKPQEIIDDEEAAKTGKGNSRERDGEERTAGCRCVIL